MTKGRCLSLARMPESSSTIESLLPLKFVTAVFVSSSLYWLMIIWINRSLCSVPLVLGILKT